MRVVSRFAPLYHVQTGERFIKGELKKDSKLVIGGISVTIWVAEQINR